MSISSLEEIVNCVARLTDIEELKDYLLSVIAAQQQELVKTKSSVEDFRAVHNLDDLYEKRASLSAFIDPVINNEILHLRQLLRSKEDELRAVKKERDLQGFSPQSSIGKELVKRCEVLLLENEELAKIILQSQVQPLTLDLFKEREAAKTIKSQLSWMRHYNAELEEENEFMFKKSMEQAEEIKIMSQSLQKENEELVQKIEKLTKQKQEDPSHKPRVEPPHSKPSAEGLPQTDDRSRRDEKASVVEDKTRVRDKREPEKQEPWYASFRREEKHDLDRKNDRYDAKRRSTTSQPKRDDMGIEAREEKNTSSKEEKFLPVRAESRISPRKDDRSRRPAAHPSRPVRRSREPLRDTHSPHRRERYRSPKTARRH